MMNWGVVVVYYDMKKSLRKRKTCMIRPKITLNYLGFIIQVFLCMIGI
jgi:hypothetical protein